MIGRAAEKNCSIFLKEACLRPLDEVIKKYLKYCIDYDNHFANAKYCVQQMLGSLQETPRGKRLLGAQQLKEIW